MGQYSKTNITVKNGRDILLTMVDKAEKLCACHLSDSIGELESSMKNIYNLGLIIYMNIKIQFYHVSILYSIF